MKRILVVEDNPDLAFGLRNNLEIEGYAVDVAEDGVSGLERACANVPDLVILDLMLPGMDGFRVLHGIRHAGHRMPVLMLTARGEETDKVRGLKLGADDYVTKPFSLLELLARVEALLRRGALAPATVDDGVEHFGDVEIQRDARVVRRGGAAVELSPKEFDLLLALVDRRGRVATRLDLMREVWGHRAAILSRTVDTHIGELRRKLEADPAAPRHILTIRKAGYRLER